MDRQTGATLGMSGLYNKNSSVQLSLIESSIPYIKESIENLEIKKSSYPIILADYGSSHGSNSVYIMKLLIECINERNQRKRSFLIIHNDLPTNDWNSLFNILNEQEEIYFGLANGKSFYKQCLPSNCLTIGYTSSSIHWLSKKPCNISNHCMSTSCDDKERQAFQSQAYEDYSQFLENRSNELISGGILIINTVCVNDQGESMMECLYNLLYKCAKLLPLNEDELMNYTIPVYLRSYNECLDEELFEKYSFQLIKSDRISVDFNFCEQWKTGYITLEEYVRIHVGMMRCGSECILKQTLEMNKKRSEEEMNYLLNKFWEIYSEEIKSNPELFYIKSYQTYLILKKF